jgi:hypothetical protein
MRRPVIKKNAAPSKKSERGRKMENPTKKLTVAATIHQ